MKKTNNKKKLSVILSFVLIVVIALTLFGCTSNKNNGDVNTTAPSTSEQKAEPTVLGEGAVQFSFSVTHKDGSVADFTVKTDKKTVGEALLDAKLIEGEDGQYGLYVKTVDGEKLDENYIDGQLTVPQTVDMPHVVEKDHVFVLGDNRGVSLDSRYEKIGDIHEHDIFGKLLFRLSPFGKVN